MVVYSFLAIFRRSLWNRRMVCGMSTRHCSTKMGGRSFISDDNVKIRNIGIMAHIDAGKTTTTERMLFYAGFSRVMGDVDDGDTVMDYMEQERARGITITSAAITFPWLEHRINLIDTPGHVDFTIEVERSLRALDGAIAILDASAGVEAQSLTVWRQADRYKVPRIIYLNKMDKSRASVELCLNSVREKLKVKPLMTQLPVFEDSLFIGLVDLLTMKKLTWSPRHDNSGKTFSIKPLKESDDDDWWLEAAHHRRKLVENVVDLDDAIAESVLETEDLDSVSPSDLEMALRRITISQTGVPVFCGSSYKNVGVQPLMDAVIKYLPMPSERKHEFVSYYGDDLCALVFKIVHDKYKGRITFIRIYSGSLERGQRLYNLNRKTSERITSLLIAYADDFEEVSKLGSGHIAAVTGLHCVITGDTLVSSQGSAKDASKRFKKESGKDDAVVLAGVTIPPPVFFCSIEPASARYQKPLEQALELLQVEDPSLKVKTDHDTGQTVISGMGELHIDIIKDRLLKEHNVEAYLGPIQVAYRETITDKSELKHNFERSLGNVCHRVSIHLSVEPRSKCPTFEGLKVAYDREARNNLSALRADHFEALTDGVAMSVNSGPLLGFPLTDIAVFVHNCIVEPGTSLLMISAAAAQCLRLLLETKGSVRLLEPIMSLEIVTDDRCLHQVLGDLSNRRSRILEVDARHDSRIIRVRTPLAELLGYATALRVITSGMATFSMEFHEYEHMTANEQQKAIQRVTGVVVDH